MYSTITVVKKHADMSVKNDVSGGVLRLIFLYVNIPESTQSCDG